MLWMINCPIKNIMVLVRMSKVTAADWGSFCREVVEYSFKKHSQQLGGVGKVVELDESVFGRRKYNVGRVVEQSWVFGAYERGTGNVLLQTVTFRDTKTLIPTIKKWIRPGTTIITDCWKVYDNLPRLGYIHLKVNHSKNFKDPVTGAHTNSIESTWRAAKAVMSHPGRKRSAIPGNFYKRSVGWETWIHFWSLCVWQGNYITP